MLGLAELGCGRIVFRLEPCAGRWLVEPGHLNLRADISTYSREPDPGRLVALCGECLSLLASEQAAGGKEVDLKQLARSLYRLALVSAVAAASIQCGYGYSHVRRGPTAPNHSKHHEKKHAAQPIGPRAMESDRAAAIQTALIKAGYLTGTPTGHWDAESEAAIKKMQADNGWQTKITPDSRALIKLGLGPNEAGAGTTARAGTAVEAGTSDRGASGAGAPAVSSAATNSPNQ